MNKDYSEYIFKLEDVMTERFINKWHRKMAYIDIKILLNKYLKLRIIYKILVMVFITKHFYIFRTIYLKFPCN